MNSVLIGLLALALAAQLGVAVGLVLVVRKQREQRTLLDRRIDGLARESHDRALALDLRADELTARVHALERQTKIDHLATLTQLCEHSGRLGADTARDLERSILDLADDARAERESAP